jgi:large subunit ribosomal protein L3
MHTPVGLLFMKFILGTKQAMTQVFDEEGLVHPATVVKAGPMTITQVKTSDIDGYTGVQVGFGSRREKNVAKAQKPKGNFMYFKEFKIDGYSVNDTVDLSVFAPGDKVNVSSISKGKGFAGVVKRHGFHGGPRSHGQKHSEREPGSLGGGGRDGGRVAKGKRMAGRMGGIRITTKGLTVVKVSPETGELFIGGAIPGRRGTLVEVVSK